MGKHEKQMRQIDAPHERKNRPHPKTGGARIGQRQRAGSGGVRQVYSCRKN